jgi:hypothetical protein
VTYNASGIAFDGEPYRRVISSSACRRRVVRQGIVVTPDLDPASVALYRLDDGGTPVLVEPMADDGDRTNGDQIQGDGFFSALVSVAATAPGAQRFRIGARTRSQPDVAAWSPVLSFPTIEHVEPAALSDAVALADDAGAVLAQLAAAGRSVRDAAGDPAARARLRRRSDRGGRRRPRRLRVTAGGLSAARWPRLASQRGDAAGSRSSCRRRRRWRLIRPGSRRCCSSRRISPTPSPPRSRPCSARGSARSSRSMRMRAARPARSD